MAEDPFRLMVESVADYAFFMLDPEGVIATWNSGAKRIKGYEASEIVGRHFSVFYPEEALDRDLPAYELAIAAATGRYEEEGWRIRKDGTRFWAHVVITAVRSRTGGLAGFSKVTRDLTERRQAEEAMRESIEEKTRITAELASANSYLRNVLNASTLISVIATDRDGMITLFNLGAEAMLGYRADEVIGRQTPALFHDAAEMERRGAELSSRLGRRVEGFEVFTRSIGDARYEQLDWTYIHKDGHRLTVHLALSAVLGDAGQTIGYLGVAEDVTERQRTAKKIADAYEQMNSVLESTSEGVLKVQRDWTIAYGNRRAIERLPDFAVGRSLWDCFGALLGTSVEQSLRRTMEDRVETSWENYYAPYDLSYRSHCFPTGDGISIFFRDISEEKKLREQLALEQVLRERRIGALSHMAGGLAHEINNPLAIIHARASDLRALISGDDPVPADEVRAACGSIVHTCDRAIRILRGLRGFAREAGSDPMEYASIYDIVERCLDVQESRFLRHRVELRVALEPDIPLLLCRETQIGQILTNLLNNAFDAIDQSGSQERWVSLTAGVLASHLWVDVTDSGPAIEDEFRSHLMDPFFNAAERGAGMGVGLSLSNAIAEDHGGTLAVAPETERACFRLTLPFRTEASRTAIDAGAAIPPAALSNRSMERWTP
jgi:PAS domain S-box-containing protein